MVFRLATGMIAYSLYQSSVVILNAAIFQLIIAFHFFHFSIKGILKIMFVGGKIKHSCYRPLMTMLKREEIMYSYLLGHYSNLGNVSYTGRARNRLRSRRLYWCIPCIWRDQPYAFIQKRVKIPFTWSMLLNYTVIYEVTLGHQVFHGLKWFKEYCRPEEKANGIVKNRPVLKYFARKQLHLWTTFKISHWYASITSWEHSHYYYY